MTETRRIPSTNAARCSPVRTCRALPLLEENGFLPDLDAIDDETLARTALLWLNYPNNPTAAVAPLASVRATPRAGREHDFLLASDEAYSELWFTEPPASALQVADRVDVVVFNTLSKRSSMTGYRSGFVAGPRWVVGRAPGVPPDGRHRAAGVRPARVGRRVGRRGARGARASDVYRRKREVLLGALEASAGASPASEATMYLWVAVPAGESSEELAERLLERGIVVAPGAYLGPSGEGYVRFALVPTVEECERAAAILRSLA